MDPRIARSRESLQGALLALARERPLEEITVAEVAEAAGVNRSTLYQHYQDRDDLLADALDAEAQAAAQRLPPTSEMLAGPPPALVAYLVSIAENAAVYRSVLSKNGSAFVSDRLRERIEEITRSALGEVGTANFDAVPVDVVAAGISGSVLGVLRAWLNRDEPVPVEVAVRWVWNAVMGPHPRATSAQHAAPVPAPEL